MGGGDEIENNNLSSGTESILWDVYYKYLWRLCATIIIIALLAK